MDPVRRSRMPNTLVILPLALAASCSFVPGGRIGFTLHSREIVLSSEHHENDFLKAKLVSIAEDGTTRIQTLTSGETLEAPVGGYFVGTNAYGSQGLRLVSASRQEGEARFKRMWCEGTRR
jgi:hypothetical protein